MSPHQILPECFSSEHQKLVDIERMADAHEKQLDEINALRTELEKTRQELADYKAQQSEQHQSDAQQQIDDHRKLLRHDYLVAAFTVALTLFLEHFFDIADFLKPALKMLLALFE